MKEQVLDVSTGKTYYREIPDPVIRQSVPQSLTRAKGLVVIKRAGLLDTVKAIVAAKDAQDGESQIRFDNAATFDRTDPLLIYVAAQHGLTAEQLDQMFIDGDQLW